MKRTKQISPKKGAKTDKKAIIINPSDVYEIEFTTDAAGGKIKRGDKKLVSLPIAVKFHNQGKAKLTPETIAIAKEKGMPIEDKKAGKPTE